MDEQKSFVLYTGYRELLCKLTDEQLGRVFRGILDCANGDSVSDTGDAGVDMALSFILADMRRNHDKWRDTRRKRQAAAKVRWDAEKGTEGQKNKPDRGNGQTYNLAEIEALMKANSEL